MAFPDFISRTFASIVVAGTLLVSPVLANEAESEPTAMKVIVDRAKVVRISRPADTVIIGNPSIVDATVQDSQTLVLTGRSFGVTNLIVLDSNGEAFVDETVVVQAHETNTVRIYRRAMRETLACSPVCEPTLTIGDTPDTFNNSLSQINSRNQLSQPTE